MTASDVPTFDDPVGRTLRAACVQLVGGADKMRNLERAELGFEEAAEGGAQLVVLPEKWNVLGDPEVLHAGAEAMEGETVTAVRGWARRFAVWTIAGSFVERVSGQERLSNTSLLIDPAGEIRAAYRKMHMFDVDVAGIAYRESDSETPGDEIVVADVDGARIGMTVCYDLRFPELYRILALHGATVVTVPAAFTERTGRDHWEVLLRARAIENQCFVLAAGIIGPHDGGKVSYGRSMIIDPWGVVMAQAPDRECVVHATLHFDDLARIRRRVPSLASRRPEAYVWPD